VQRDELERHPKHALLLPASFVFNCVEIGR
jgi:hypothetical protein